MSEAYSPYIVFVFANGGHTRVHWSILRWLQLRDVARIGLSHNIMTVTITFTPIALQTRR